MSGSQILADDEKQEMLLDASDPGRREAFAGAQRLSHRGDLDDYIDFLSENMGSVGRFFPRVHVTIDYRL